MIFQGRSSTTAASAFTAVLAGVLLFACTAPAGAITWSLPPSDVSLPTGNDPEIAVAPDGSSTIAFSQPDGPNNRIAVATRPAGQTAFPNPGTTTPEFLSASGASGNDAFNQRIVIGPDGSTTVVWQQAQPSGNAVVQARTRPAGSSTWGTVDTLSDPADGDAAVTNGVAMAVGPDGAVTVAWILNTGGGTILQSATRSAGQALFPDPDLLASQGAPDKPKVAVGADGATTVVWVRYVNPPGANAIQAISRPAGSGTWGSAETISDPSLGSANEPEIAIAPDGTTTAVWSYYPPSYLGEIMAATRPAGQASFPNPTVNTPDTLSTEIGVGGTATIDNFGPSITVAPDGATTVIWSSYDQSEATNNRDRVRASVRPAGQSSFPNPTTTAPEVLSPTGINARYARSAAAPDGTTTVVWQGLGPSFAFSEIQAATRPAGQSTFPASISLNNGVPASEVPKVAAGADGSFTAAWITTSSGGAPPYTVQAAGSGALQYTLTSQLAGDGTGTVSSFPAGIDCGSICSSSFNLSSRVTLTATPASDSTFTGWSGACSGTSTTCTVTILGNRSATATFAKGSPTPPTPPTPPSPPSNEFTVTSSRALSSSAVTRVRVPGAGKIRQRGTYRTAGASSTATRTACTATRTASGAGTYTITCRLNSAARKQRRKGKLRVRIRTTYTPTGGTARSTIRTVTFRSLKPRYTG